VPPEQVDKAVQTKSPRAGVLERQVRYGNPAAVWCGRPERLLMPIKLVKSCGASVIQTNSNGDVTPTYARYNT
jgi:hypothetical protein